MKMTITKGTKKTGDIPSFNLPPIKSCPNNATCAQFFYGGKVWKCYAVKPYTQYPLVKKCWDANFELAKENIPSLEKKLTMYFKTANILLFRVHVSGDFFSQDYVDMWLRLSRRFKSIKFLAYTKVYGWFKGKDIPTNFVVFFSFMPAVSVHRALKTADNFPVALAYGLGKSERVPGFITCPEQTTKKITCLDCRICWNWKELKAVQQGRLKGIHFIVHK